MKNNICYNCFKLRGDYDVCPHCGYVDGTPPPQSDMLSPGTILYDGDYQYIIGTVIGRGGFGIIYKAFDVSLSMMVAIKENYPAKMVNRGAGEKRVGICSGEKEAEYKTRLERFFREARNMAEFSKEDDIVRVYKFFQANNTAYIVMEYVEGVLLKDYLKDHGKIDVKEAEGYTISILNALSKLHEKGVIHRDISPDNIFLMGDGKIKLIDFGAAAFLRDNDRGESLEPVIKPGYAPPEQYASENEVGTYMDVYSAGAVMYQMITGEKPCEGSDRQSGFEKLKKPSAYKIPIPKKEEKIIMKAMAVRVDSRFQTAVEFRDALVKQIDVEDPDEEEEKKRQKKAIRLMVSTIIVLSLMMGGLIYFLARYSSQRLGELENLSSGTLTVWLAGEETTTESDRITHLKELFQNSRIRPDIREIAYDDYAAELKKAQESNKMPDVFCTDYLEDKEDSCITLNKLQKTMSDMDDYPKLGLSGFGMFSMPTGYRVALLYQDTEKCEEQGIEIKETVQPSDLKALDENKLAVFDGVDKLADASSDLSSVLADSSYFDSIGDLTIRATPAREIGVSLVCNKDGQGLTEYCDFYGVNADCDSNKREAGMHCILFLMYQQLQIDTYMTGTRGIPLEKKAEKQYQEAHLTGYLDCIGDNIDQLKAPVESKTIEYYYDEILK